MQTEAQGNLDAIIDLGEQFISLAMDFNMPILEKELPVYSQQIEQFFIGLDKGKLTSTDVESLEQLMDNHKKIISIISEKKGKISNNIKQLHTGKEMQNTYSRKAY